DSSLTLRMTTETKNATTRFFAALRMTSDGRMTNDIRITVVAYGNGWRPERLIKQRIFKP
ncbi:MAG: hypothetical protein N3B12_03245, partial [Armatimonadetes bacterium]|nr:hypothetical protein [Armatimonadota bacterium]